MNFDIPALAIECPYDKLTLAFNSNPPGKLFQNYQNVKLQLLYLNKNLFPIFFLKIKRLF